MNPVERVLHQELTGLLDRLATSVPEGGFESIRASSPTLKARVDDADAKLAAVRESLLDSYAIDFLSVPVDPAAPAQSAEGDVIRQHLDRAVAGRWENFPSPGEGADWRLEDEQLTGAALIWEDKVVVHLQLFPRTAQGSQPQMPNYRPRVRRYGSSPPPVE